ncbi:MAG TPA: aminotransferase class V-fold PLP-dependent enzyme [Bryobacteraceae bacterium]|nr:aminotransferase class V-fold PLP-dependent enzyme [Bryobacteraceae bacterium]
MPHRRSFLKSLAGPALAAPLFAQNAVPPMPRADDPAYWDKIRDQFLLARDKVFFNTGTIGAMPRVVFERTVEHLRLMATDVADWDYHGENWIGGYDDMAGVRTKAARLLNASLPEIGLTENVTAAMSYVAAGLDLDPGAEIIISNQEHPGGQSPWLNAAKRRKAVVKTVELPRPIHDRGQALELVSKAITPATRVIAISHVITGSGAILPAKEICAEARSRGILTVLDGAQAFGHIPVDVRDLDCDVYVGCFHKWLLAPAGTGFLYVRRDREKDIWTSLASSNWNNHNDDGYRFTQRGTGSMSLLKGLDAALDFHVAIGPERVQSRIKYLGDYLRAGLRRFPKVKMYSPDDESMCAAITVYGVEGVNGAQLQDEMWKRRLRPRSSGSTGVRHCTHIYNSTAEIDRALAVVRALS